VLLLLRPRRNHNVLHGVAHLGHELGAVLIVNALVLNEDLPESDQSVGVLKHVVIVAKNLQCPIDPLRTLRMLLRRRALTLILSVSLSE